MALPKLNDSPRYSVKIPSTGKRIRFRPYLVKEEKVLMIAAETQDPKITMNAIADTIEACCEGSLDRAALTTFDVEFLFTKIRAKSAGETARILLPCDECESNNEVQINLDALEVDVPKKETVHEIAKGISIELRYPPFNQIVEYDLDNLSKTETGFSLASECIKAIVTEEERIDCAEVSREELQEFIESMTADQFQIILEHMNSMPKLEHTCSFKCFKCGTENEQHIEGMQNFF